jgi:O-succinylbenzoic acid--CoA ligase
VAIEAPEARLDYAQLLDAALDAAGALEQLGAHPGARVALELPTGLDFVVAFHGCLLAGAVAVPIDLRLTEAEREQRRVGADIIVSSPFPSALAGQPARHVDGGGSAGDLVVMHTSGTTAAPRAVTLTYGNFLASALGSAVVLGLDPAERWLCPLPLTHVGGLSTLIRSAIYATTAVVCDRFDTDAVLAELMDEGRRTTLVSLVPTMLVRLLDAGLERPRALRWALLGGGPIAPALLDRAAEAGVPVAPTYGMTEACSQIATFGWPLPGVELRLDEDGEVLVRGPIVSPGAADEQGWLHTGDLARLDERGRVVITGRKSDTIVTGGENVAPTEVEGVLLEHPAVRDAAVHARPDPEWGERVVATVVVRNGVAAGVLQAHCAARLAAFKVPKEIRFAEVLPRTVSGKLLRREL